MSVFLWNAVHTRNNFIDFFCTNVFIFLYGIFNLQIVFNKLMCSEFFVKMTPL